MKLNKIEQDILNKNKVIVGVDECGRGCIAGPLVISAIIIPFFIKEDNKVKDSKKMTEKQRRITTMQYRCQYHTIIAYHQPKYNLNEAYKECCDYILEQMNILIKDKKLEYEILTDQGIAQFFKVKNVREFIKGDNNFFSIALASIMGKYERDEYIKELSKEEKYSYYDLYNNKGYLTKKHKEGIKKYGFSDLHRKFYKINDKNLIRQWNYRKIFQKTIENPDTGYYSYD